MTKITIPENLLINDRAVAQLRQKLLYWFISKKRDLPWRREPSLYGTWISEIMLQQTTVATVVPYWENFMTQFPNVQTLASASEAEVLTFWSGLGYYRRARHLHAAAHMIMKEYDGQLPTSSAVWKTLPGVGAYAAGAIASLGLGEVVPAVDVNARRVITRVLVDDVKDLSYLKPRLMHALALRLVDPERPGLWNEALMELGAIFCSSRNPQCDPCPLRTHCRASKANLQGEIPGLVKRKDIQKVVMAQWLILTDSGIVVVSPGAPPLYWAPVGGEIIRDDFSSLHQGLWTLPQTSWFADVPGLDPELFLQHFGKALKANSKGLFRSRTQHPEYCGKFSHTITHHRIRVENLVLDLRGYNEAVILKELKLLFSASWGHNRGNRRDHSFEISLYPLDSTAMPCLPVSKMIDKALHLLKESFI